MKAVLRYLQNRHPSAVIDAMCSGPETVTETYGIDAVQMFCFDRYDPRLAGPLASILRLPSRSSRSLPHLGVGTPTRHCDRPGCRRPGSKSAVAPVEHSVRPFPPQRIRQTLQDQGGIRQRRSEPYPQASHTMARQLGGPVGLLPVVPRRRLSGSHASAWRRHPRPRLSRSGFFPASPYNSSQWGGRLVHDRGGGDVIWRIERRPRSGSRDLRLLSRWRQENRPLAR